MYWWLLLWQNNWQKQPKKWGGKEVSWGSEFQGTICDKRGVGVIAAGAWGSRSHCVHHQEAKRDERWCSAHCLPSVQVGTPSPQKGTAHIQSGPCLFLEKPSETHAEMCFHANTEHSQTDDGEGTSHLAFDIRALFLVQVSFSLSKPRTCLYLNTIQTVYIAHWVRTAKTLASQPFWLVSASPPKKNWGFSKGKAFGSLGQFQIEVPKLHRKWTA